MKIALAIAVSLVILPGQAATGGKGKALAATPSPTRTSTATGHGGSTLRTMRDPRRAPELDPTRKVSERDCTKPLDLNGGNLRCK
jgi:hypothetical protein